MAGDELPGLAEQLAADVAAGSAVGYRKSIGQLSTLPAFAAPRGHGAAPLSSTRWMGSAPRGLSICRRVSTSAAPVCDGALPKSGRDGLGGEAQAHTVELTDRLAVACGEIAELGVVDRDAVLAPLSHDAPLERTCRLPAARDAARCPGARRCLDTQQPRRLHLPERVGDSKLRRGLASAPPPSAHGRKA